MRLLRSWVCCYAIVGLFLASSLSCETSAPKGKEGDSASAAKQVAEPASEESSSDPDRATDEGQLAESEEDPFAVPDGTAEELFAYIESVQKLELPRDSEQEFKAFVKKIIGSSIEAADKIMAGEATDEQFVQAVQFKLQTLALAKRVDFGDTDDQRAEFIESLKKEKRPAVVALVKKIVEREEAIARRLALVGNPMELEGTLLDKSPFDWSAYKGKVVLVDFWATWCGPCRQEMPNVKKAYAQYHEKGFDVVGISLDKERDAVEAYMKNKKIPWVTLFSDDEEATGWEHPMAGYYGVSGIPTTILVGQDGNVVALSARGLELGEQLQELLGDPLPIEEQEEDEDGQEEEGDEEEGDEEESGVEDKAPTE